LHVGNQSNSDTTLKMKHHTYQTHFPPLFVLWRVCN